jgi:hypothetical protein
MHNFNGLLIINIKIDAKRFFTQTKMILYILQYNYPAWSRLEYLHRSPASGRRRRKGNTRVTPRPCGHCNAWSAQERLRACVAIVMLGLQKSDSPHPCGHRNAWSAQERLPACVAIVMLGLHKSDSPLVWPL